ncbi:MAG: hypothetical protein A3F54_05755 [Candidatus Kerfeldbacteria bacterium RIFCSPHIGHO2_12_FULL_48_17]|uniref:Methyltransferase type 11 domain-containing protein n=1 Tax=Candidatus Kerfeldbacteria bacterium RIFCSPHIGHO2_12_FULL_48_17 TaxID=1798542 RepID=A0A1G2B5Y3_9BACT|nr:MAG: hypothetical protein A3F54_05755 [Candidatus Kerfeldbacteria bacterium RIFCSPHIGHO2_12_FULL_48_17]
MLPQYIQQTIQAFDQSADTHARQAAKINMAPQRELFIKYLKGQSILDIGCGAGRDVAWFSEQGYHVTGIDLSEKLICKAKVCAPQAVFMNIDMRKVKFPDNTFDGVWACASLLHLKKAEVAAALQDWERVLKEEGVLFVGVREGAGEVMEDGKWYANYSAEELAKYIKKAGFKILEKAAVTKWVNIYARKL